MEGNPLISAAEEKELARRIEKGDLEHYKNPTFVNISKAAIDLADGIIKGSAKINSDVEKYIKKSGKPPNFLLTSIQLKKV